MPAAVDAEPESPRVQRAENRAAQKLRNAPDGFTTIVFPQARAGAIFHEAMTMGKFQGVMRAQTPTGSRRVTSRPLSWTGTVSPKILLAAPP